MNERIARRRLLDRWKRQFPSIDWASVSNAEIVRTIGSRISTFVTGCMRNSGIDWKVKYAAEETFLSALGVSENDALSAAEGYIKDQKSVGCQDGVRRPAAVIGETRISASMSRNLPVLYVETEDTGFGSCAEPVWLFDCRPIEGTTASVCPQSSPLIPHHLAETIAAGFRRRGMIGSNQTIHWRGHERGLAHVCYCFSSATKSKNPATNDASANSERKWTDWHRANEWCQILTIGSGHFARWWKDRGFVLTRDLEVSGSDRRFCLQSLAEKGYDYRERLERSIAAKARRS